MKRYKKCKSCASYNNEERERCYQCGFTIFADLTEGYTAPCKGCEALEQKYSEAVEFITGLSEPEQCPDSCKCERYDTKAATDEKIFCEQRSICLDCISEKAKDLLSRHKGEV